MPLLQEHRFSIMRRLDDEFMLLDKIHNENAPKGGTIPVGGGDWMDSFFRMEAIRGTLGGLRRGLSLKKAVEEGKAVSEISVKIWNGKQGYQVHRWVKTAHTYLDRLMKRVR